MGYQVHGTMEQVFDKELNAEVTSRRNGSLESDQYVDIAGIVRMITSVGSEEAQLGHPESAHGGCLVCTQQHEHFVSGHSTLSDTVRAPVARRKLLGIVYTSVNSAKAQPPQAPERLMAGT